MTTRRKPADQQRNVSSRRRRTADQEEAPEPTRREILDQLKALERALREVQRSGLNRRAILVLMKDHTGIPFTQIEKVIDGLAELRKEYTV